MNSFHQYVRSIAIAFAIIAICRLYPKYVPMTDIYVDLFLALFLGIVSAGATIRTQSPSSVKVTVTGWEDFWHDFMALIRESGYSPICKMNDTYFFESRWLGQKTQITLKKIADNQWQIDFPQGLHRLIKKKIGIYNQIPMLSADKDS
jgi:hypothetical protein